MADLAAIGAKLAAASGAAEEAAKLADEAGNVTIKFRAKGVVAQVEYAQEAVVEAQAAEEDE